jgi:ubiquinone/menaquinone biosynthesis C-methylase UbiE
MPFQWPPGFNRIPDDDWTRAPVETLALKYDTVNRHGWYRNLDPTVEDLAGFLRDGHLLIDYSGGTGILVERLLRRVGGLGIGIVVVDSSPKFLRLALDKFRDDSRVAFRWIRYLKDLKRLEFADEALGEALVRRGADALASTNAIHLYYDLEETLRSWARVLRPAARAFVQSGNIRCPNPAPGEWIIDDTVEAIHRAALEVVARDERYARYRPVLSNSKRMAAYAAYREKVFVPVRPLHDYLAAIRRAGLRVESVQTRPIEARVKEWFDFLAVYHDAVLGWIGGVEKIDGRPASAEAVNDRLSVLRAAMQIVFEGADAFTCGWTYITCARKKTVEPSADPPVEGR